jgi:alanyl-tRNA synthetase
MSNYENFDEQKQFACRVIADHARSTAFAIADGILPGNEGRNYVLRKIMRRAIYHGREHLGLDKLFFHQVCGFVVEQMKDAYPELAVQKDFIDKMVRLEEERFGNTMTVGLKKLDEILTKSDFELTVELLQDEFAKLPRIIQTSELAKLYDTFGLPIDLMFVVLKSKYPTVPHHDSFEKYDFWTIEKTIGSKYTGIKKHYSLVDTIGYVGDNYEVFPFDSIKQIDEAEFRELIDDELKQLQANSEIGKTKQAEKINPIYAALQRRSDVRTEFVGYDATSVKDAKVVALVKDNNPDTKELNAGEEGLIILDKTPFYAESGGQVGDIGTIQDSKFKIQDTNNLKSEILNLKSIKVFDTFAPVKEYVLHKSKVESGTIKVGDIVSAQVDVEKRDATRRNHTATHLAHSALREVLGTHVKQAGSVVSPNYLRFDFTHYQPLSALEIKEIEDLVNYQILQNSKVNTDLMSIDEAMRTGAMALFGEKYGEKVRVLSVGNGEFSRELCGGTHVNATGDIGSFKITADEAIASGVRRIRAITGFDSFERFREAELLIANSLNALKTQRDNLPSAIEKLQEELKKSRKEVDDLKMKIATGAIGGSTSNDEAKDVNGVKVIAKIVEGLDKGGMRHLSDSLMAKIKSGVVIIAKTEDDKVSFIVRVSDDLTKQVSAGNIVREIAPIVNGRGGGKPDMAEGGGTDASKLNEAIEASYGVVEKMITA